ncbi:POTRA domain-containing protein [Treponema sp.]|uniref:POTRA domain-containing protein n=1 Tax=Treponema sp. TaxID=166 RepID=UPI00388E9C1F
MKKIIFVLLFIIFPQGFFSQSSEPKTRAQLANDTAQVVGTKEQADISDSQEKTENSQADKNQIDSNLTVTRINFTGLKKTRNSYIQSKVSKFTGKSIRETDLHALETAVQLEGLFDDIQISTEQISETEAQINISVKEKITFIPLPFAMYSNSGFMAGGVVMDTNAFGQKHMFMLGGFFSNTSKTAMASVAKNSKTKGIPSISIFISGSKSSPEYENLDNDTVLKYDALSFGIGLSLSEKINDCFSFTNSFGFKYLDTSDNSNYKGLAPESLIEGTVSAGLGYSKSDWNGIFMSTNSASVSVEAGLNKPNDADYRFPLGFSFAISEQHPVFTDRLRIYQRYSGFFGHKNHLSSFKSQSAGSVTILPGNFVSEKIIGGNTGLELAVAKFGWGMISLYSDYQIVYTQDFDKDYHFMHGPNGGARFYLAKIAFPALSMGVSYNVPKNYWQFAAAMGMTF